uniref:RING-type domain-containing protein n=1 Tax=Pyrodinium bahamense TaxID=73915 RepID=A0A7S0FA63_9DINO|mmetsp:Transcript_15484/g.42751  ORF Transcript_15484/g.42751 Transcript_15484/m.42751 type:complete len:252 (+) Transcript_15484:64-819(+)
MEGHAAAELIGSFDVGSDFSCAPEAQCGACVAGPDFHVPVLSEFYRRCLQEPADEPEGWSTGDIPYRNTFGNIPQVRVTATVTPMGVAGQPITGSMAGHTGTSMGAVGAFCLHLRLSRTDGAPQLRTGVQAGSDSGPRVEFLRLQGAGEPAGDRVGRPRQRPCRQPRFRAFTLVKAHSRVGILVQDSQEACSICLEGIHAGELARTLPCFHMLHSACSRQYFRTRGALPSCPVCRCSIAPSTTRNAGENEA